MNYRSFALLLLSLSLICPKNPALAQTYPSGKVVLQITIKVHHTASFVELKAESDQVGERATGRLTTEGPSVLTWEMGSPNQNIWIWWDRLQGAAYLKVQAVLDGRQTLLFECECDFSAHGREASPTNTCPEGFVKGYGSPSVEPGNGRIDYIRF